MSLVEPKQESLFLIPSLAPPLRLETGCIVLLRMRGHTQTEGREYFAPAVVLNQHQPHGEIEVLIWDSTAGTHYNPAYAIRDLSSRGEGDRRELYEVQSNIGGVLFSPNDFMNIRMDLDIIRPALSGLTERVFALIERLQELETALGASVNASASQATAPDPKAVGRSGK